MCLLSRGAREDESSRQPEWRLCVVGVWPTGVMVIRPAAVGVIRSCRRWHLGPGVEWDVPWVPGHLRLVVRPGRERCSGRHVCPHQTTTHQERQTSVERCWSRSRIVSALLAAAQGGCHPSLGPPNPDAATMGSPGDPCRNRRRFDTAIHRWPWGFMKVGASHQCKVVGLLIGNRPLSHPSAITSRCHRSCAVFPEGELLVSAAAAVWRAIPGARQESASPRCCDQLSWGDALASTSLRRQDESRLVLLAVDSG